MPFYERLQQLRDVRPTERWYRYNTLSNLFHIERMLTGERRAFFSSLVKATVADIGCADGDMGFYLESLGHDVDLIDNPRSNGSGMMAVRTLRERLGSSASIHEIDLNGPFHLPRERYDVIMFLGILYHLKNPHYVLEALAKQGRYCFLNTRVARFTPSGMPMDDSLAYLLKPGETNNDNTNVWVFSPSGLRVMLDRSGWDVLDSMTVGATETSDPVHADRDERAFFLLQSRST